MVFQRIRFLLEDCTRQDARLWMLVKSGKVANRYRVVGRDLATALEIFPVSLIDLSNESKDCVEFVARQTRRLGSVVDSGVCWGLNLIDQVMKGFERGVIPDPNNLKLFLRYLGVRNWGDCEAEIKFLEEEISSHSENGLLGFMIYCRCVVFDVLCTEGVRRNVCESKDDGVVLLSHLNEEDLRCPISLEIMTDPVTISTGHTYDRESISKWFKEGNPICPTTGKRLRSIEWVPNSALQRLARKYAMENGIEIPKSGGGREHRVPSTDFVASQAYSEAVKMASDYLSIKLAIGTVKESNKAAYEVRLLTKRNGVNRSLSVESGMIPYLLNLLLMKDSTAQENAIAALLNLSKHTMGKSAIVQSGGLQLIVKVLKDGMKLEAKQHAAAVLFYLSSMEENRPLIGAMPEVIPALMDLIKVGGDRGKKSALITIFGLLMHPSNHQKCLGANLVPLLSSLLSSLTNEDLITDSVAVLSALAEKPEGAAAILRDGNLNVVVSMFCSSSCRSTREHCASLLQSLCIHGGRDVVQVLAKNPSLIGSLYSLLTQGTPRAGKKARTLIGILQDFSEKGSSSSVAHNQVPHGRFIHVR
ncbi:hypothetical protein V2J09_002570 [Rumex salicifolius]